MGIGASKSKESKRGATTKLGKGVVIPEDTEPYPGFQVQYHMIDVQVCVYNVTTFKYTRPVLRRHPQKAITHQSPRNHFLASLLCSFTWY